MRLILPLLAIVVLAASGCGSSSGPSDETVVRDWSSALNDGDNDRAAGLFAHDARVVQGNAIFVFHTRAQARVWNASLPCSGKIVGLERQGHDVTATFVLGDRPGSPCDGPGETARALFRISHGKIVLWHQLDTETDTGPQV